MVINIIIVFLIGIILGSFLNSLVYRLYRELSLWDRSFCPKCKKKLKANDLIPLLSYLFLKGKCRYCQLKINSQYFFIELITGLLFILFYINNQLIDLLLFRNLFLVFVLVFIFVFDWKYLLILNSVIYPSLILVFILNLMLGVLWWQMLLGAVIGGGFFMIQYYLTRKKGIGTGDIHLGIFVGVVLGWQHIIVALMVSYIIGGFIAVVLLISKKRNRKDVLPLGPFIVIGTLIVLLIGDSLVKLLYG